MFWIGAPGPAADASNQIQLRHRALDELNERGPAVLVREKLILFMTAQVVLCGITHWIFETYRPDPSGLWFTSPVDLLGWAIGTAPPLVIGLWARSWIAVLLIAVAQALSPLVMLPTAQDPTQDFNFIMLLWWFYLPPLALLVVVADRSIALRRIRRSLDQHGNGKEPST